MKHGSLFSGIGGFDLAAEWMGWENVFLCERDPFCQKILSHYSPKARLYEEVKKFEAAEYRGGIDILSGGFPCQPFSVFGKRRGTADQRYLWPEMCRVVREVRPRWVVGENVLGLLSWDNGMVFEQVQADLEGAGYEVWPYILPAAGVGAPHRRERIFFVAHANGDGVGQGSDGQRLEETTADRRDISVDGPGGQVANTLAEDLGAAIRARGDRSTAEQFVFRGSGAADWDEFPTQPPFCTGDDGVSAGLDGISFSRWRAESLRAAGNAVVPQVVWRIFKVIEKLEGLWRGSK